MPYVRRHGPAQVGKVCLSFYSFHDFTSSGRYRKESKMRIHFQSYKNCPFLYSDSGQHCMRHTFLTPLNMLSPLSQRVLDIVSPEKWIHALKER